jgi:hypothetical protein
MRHEAQKVQKPAKGLPVWSSLTSCVALNLQESFLQVCAASDAMQSLFVVNKAGSLIFYRKFVDTAPQVSQNDQLHLASTFHGMQLLVQQLSPLRSQHGFGIETLETSSYVLQAYRPETGVQFFVTSDLRTDNITAFLVRNYIALRIERITRHLTPFPRSLPSLTPCC